jgi:SulP family sulfate permease
VNRRIPNVLAAVIVTTALSWWLGFEKNQTVPLGQIESERVHELAAAFNDAVTEERLLEETRAEGNTLLDEQMKSVGQQCVGCHERRAADRFTVEGSDVGGQVFERKALALHQMAGLIDQRIEELKHDVSTLRTELRAFRFNRAVDMDGSSRFYPVGETVSGIEVESGIWRVKVGNSPLDLDALTVTGGGAVVGTIPAGLPPIRRPAIDIQVIPKLFAAAIIISILGFMEAISIAKAMAAITKQKLDPNQELIGQGLANIIGCMGQSYAVSGSFSRSAVNLQAGARTGMSNVFSGIIVAIVLLFFSPLLYFLPQAVLASIIMMAVVGLLNVSGFVHAWRTQPFDGAVSAITFICTLVLAPHLERGVFLGVALSLGGYLFRTMRPEVAVLAPTPDGGLRDASRHGLEQCRYLAAIRFDGPLNFANASYLEDEVLDRVSQLPDLRHVLIVADGVNEVDASGEETLRHLVDHLREAGLDVSFCGLKDQLIDVLKRSHLYDFVGDNHVYPSTARAIAAIYATAHPEPEPGCPFRTVMPRLTELSLHPDGSLRDAIRTDLPLCRHIAVLRFDDPLTYANTDFLEQEIFLKLEGRPELRQVLFVAHGIADIDPSGAQKLCQLVNTLREQGLDISFTGFRDEILEVLDRIDTDQVIGEDHRFPTQFAAIAAVYSQAHADSQETGCPFLTLAPRITELSCHPDGTLREARRHGLGLCSHVAALRFDGPMVLAKPAALEAELVRWVKDRLEATHLLLVAHTLDKLGAEDAKRLVELVERLRRAGLQVTFCSFRDHVFEVIERSGAADEIGLDSFYPSESSAIAAIYAEAHRESAEEDCPLRAMLPRVVELSLHADGSRRNARRYGLATCKVIAALRIDGALTFATVDFVADEIRAQIAGRPDLRHVLLAGHGISAIDESASERLCDLVTDLRDAGYEVSISGLKDEVLDVLERTGGLDVIGTDAVYPTRARAIGAIHEKAHEGVDESPCPLIEVVEIHRSHLE